ncbi:PA2778 family cysteine peptidase [Pelomicrobium sp.]|uniref:PA2778 family cysteine peptidase n=1 Tax=Pelomicrobium sp. TaxID=2815319 RepID=UPI002FDCD259
MRRESVPRPRAGAALLLLVLLAGCAAPQTARLLKEHPADLPPRAEIDAAPFYPQERYQCGPAALATVLVHAGVDTSPAALVPLVYLPARQGSLQVEMQAATRRHGLIAYPLAPRLEDVLREVAAGNPVVVLQNLALDLWPVWHYAVVVGYDQGAQEIVLRSGTTRRLTMSWSRFERTWARSKHWAMVAMAPQRLPATAEEHAYVAAAVALERVDASAAHQAYGTALQRWPHNLPARIGLGNTAYARGDLATAEAAYRQAVRDHPHSADAWNNLAQVLVESGRKGEALAAAQRAVSLGGPRLSLYRATLEAIQEAQ